MPDVVCAELNLIPLFRNSFRHRHYPRVQHQDIESRLLIDEFARRGLHGGEGCEVALKECDAGVGDDGLDGGYGSGGFFGGAAGEVDVRGVVVGELEGGFFA